MKLCRACLRRSVYKDGATHCNDPDCLRDRAAARKRKQRAKARKREQRGWATFRARHGTPRVVVIRGPDLELSPMTGDHTKPCKCGLELRALSGRELPKVIARHNKACIVLHQADHWSVKTMLRQKARASTPPVAASTPVPGARDLS